MRCRTISFRKIWWSKSGVTVESGKFAICNEGTTSRACQVFYAASYPTFLQAAICTTFSDSHGLSYFEAALICMFSVKHDVLNDLSPPVTLTVHSTSCNPSACNQIHTRVAVASKSQHFAVVESIFESLLCRRMTTTTSVHRRSSST